MLAEVSNLTDLSGDERDTARQILKEAISVLHEPHIPSDSATASPLFHQLGLTDAAIGNAAREHGFTILTDDLDLYLRLLREGADAINFTHLRASEFHLSNIPIPAVAPQLLVRYQLRPCRVRIPNTASCIN